jgi:hypothetical protein
MIFSIDAIELGYFTDRHEDAIAFADDLHP